MNREPAKTISESDRRRKRHDQLEVIADLWKQTLTVAGIARRVGLSEWRARQIASDHGLTRPADARDKPLSRRQARVLDERQDHTAHHVYPPTMREIVEGCNLSSTSVALYNLQILGHKGYLTRVPAVARGIVLTERGRSCSPVPPDTPARERDEGPLRANHPPAGQGGDAKTTASERPDRPHC